MCGRFAQSMTREDYLSLITEDNELAIPYDPEPIERFNAAQSPYQPWLPHFLAGR